MFSGIGGFEKGIQQAYEASIKSSELQGQDLRSGGHSDSSESGVREQQHTCIGYSEIDKYAIQIYERHFNHKNYGDATTINATDLLDFDLLVGGFPCQAFSIAGNKGGLDDARGTLFYDIARIAKEKRPKHLLLENVKGLLSHDNGRTFKLIISTFAELGYNLEWQVLNSKNFGVPQNRERVFIIGHLGECCGRQVFPLGLDDNRLDEGERGVSGKVRGVRQGRNQPNINESILETGEDRPLRIRRLTPTECERLQGYPDGWTEGVSDTQRYKTLGNSVTVSVVEEIIKRLY